MPQRPPDFAAVIEVLASGEVRFVLIGGLAMVVHGNAYITEDIDLCYSRDSVNLDRLASALAPLHPRLRVPSEGGPFRWDVSTLLAGADFKLTSDVGDIDLLSQVAGIDSFDGLRERAEELELCGNRVRVASIDDLIAMKKAAGRLGDQLHLMSLAALKRLIESPPAS